jgi:hypothetical protein
MHILGVKLRAPLHRTLSTAHQRARFSSQAALLPATLLINGWDNA